VESVARDSQNQPGPRILFCSYHASIDPSSGAALATRDLLDLLARRGWPCAVFCGPQLDFEQRTTITDLLDVHHIPFQVQEGGAGPARFQLFHFLDGGIPVSLFQPVEQSGGLPTPAQGRAFLSLFEGIATRFRPDVLLTYGGHGVTQEIIACARRRGMQVVFLLHNFGYADAAPFHSVDAVLVPSDFSRQYYRRTLGLECTALPGCVNWERVLCPEVRGEYATFVNPQPHKGVYWFARLAHELGQCRPDIPLLVVEGRGTVDWLAYTDLDLSGLTNLHRMANTPDPRHFYRVSRVVLMPSLWRESFGRVAAEALLNGIPVLASNRGALPETLRHAGFLFDILERYTPETRTAPTAAEVRPWVEMIARLWDDAAFYESECRRCRAAAATWHHERLAPLYAAFFTRLLGWAE
jgi:glycosyltransferase involved in cell wall biosynthesis